MHESLQALAKLALAKGEEIVKFLQDVLDALFNILQEPTTGHADKMVFECLVSGLRKYFFARIILLTFRVLQLESLVTM